MRIDGPPNQRDVHSTRGGPGIHVRHIRDSDETYDCVIVGAGASGLAAAKYYRDRFGEDSRILLLDPLPDFGGHSARNEFHVGPTTFLKNGGTVNLDTVTSWNQTDRRPRGHPGLLRPAVRRHARVPRRRRVQLPEHERPWHPDRPTGCARWLLFPAKDWGGQDTLIPNRTSAHELARLARDDAVVAGGAGRHRADPGGCTSDWIALKHGPKTDAGEEGDPLPAHAEALLHGLHRGPGAGDPPVPAQRPLRCSARAPRPSRPATCGRSGARASTGLRPQLRRRSPASGARRRWACRRAPRTRRRRPGRTATRRCCACSSTG